MRTIRAPGAKISSSVDQSGRWPGSKQTPAYMRAMMSSRSLTEQPPAAVCLPQSMISFAGVSKHYGRQVVFVDASFQLNPGEKAGLVGPNGSGKTTLFRMIAGEESADDGTVTVPKKLA